MSSIPASKSREAVRDFVPKLVELSETVLYGDVWQRPGLSKRDRSLITVAALMAMGRMDQFKVHVGRAVANGVTEEELSELVTHLAFYAGWPAAMSAAAVAKAALDGEKS